MQPFYHILLITNSSGKCLKLAKLPDFFPSQSSGLSRIQRGQLSYQLTRTISALTIAISQVAVVNALVFS